MVSGWWFQTCIFHSVGNGKIIPTDFRPIIFQRGRAQPPTSYIYIYKPYNPYKSPLLTLRNTNFMADHGEISMNSVLFGSKFSPHHCFNEVKQTEAKSMIFHN